MMWRLEGWIESRAGYYGWFDGAENGLISESGVVAIKIKPISV